MVAPLSDKLSLSDLDTLASATAPTLTHGPGTTLQSSSSSSQSPPPTRYSRRTAAHKAAERPPIVSRRLRRFVNDRALHLAAADIGALPTSRADLRMLFERHSTTIFSRLSQDAEAARKFAPYIDYNLDDDDDLVDEDDDTDNDSDAENEVGKYQRIDHKIRVLLKERPTVVKPLVQQVEESVLHLEHGESIVLNLPHPLSRMVAHAVAQFHCLAHRSCDVGQDRVLVIRKQTNVPLESSARLVDIIA